MFTTSIGIWVAATAIARCSIPAFEGGLFLREGGQVYTAAPRRQRLSVKRRSIVKEAECPGQPLLHQPRRSGRNGHRAAMFRTGRRVPPFHASVAGGRGGRGRFTEAYAAAARRLPLRPSANDLTSALFMPASLPATPRHLASTGNRRCQSGEEKVQELSYRLVHIDIAEASLAPLA